MISIVIINPDADTRTQLENVLRSAGDFNIVGAAANGEDGLRLVEQFKPYGVIIEPDLPDVNGFEFMQTLTRRFPMTGIIVFSRLEGDDVSRRAMLHGAWYFLKSPDGFSRLPDAVRDVERQFKRQDEFAAIQPPRKHLILVGSGKDGTGSTTLAISLAYGLAQKSENTLFIDADLPFGDAGTYLGLRPHKTLADLVEHRGHLDKAALEAIVEVHHTGFKTIVTPHQMADAVSLSRQKPQAVAEAIHQAAAWCDFCVVDAGSRIDTLSALFTPAAKLVLIVNPNPISVRNTQMLLDWLQAEHPVARHQLCLVLNKISKNQPGTPRAELLENVLHYPFRGLIPRVDDLAMLHASSHGGFPLLALKNRQPPMNYPIKELWVLVDHVYYSLAGADTV